MNKERKKELQKIQEILEAQAQILEGLKDDESDAFEAKPESLRTDDDQSNVDDLSEAHGSLEEAISKLTEVLER